MKVAPWLALALVLAALGGLAAASTVPGSPDLSDRVQIFYYGWFTNLTGDGAWGAWNSNGHQPPSDLMSPFYPQLGPYSSHDAATIQQHLEWIKESHIGTIVYSWWGPHSVEDQNLGPFLDAAQRAGMKVALHVEPLYSGPRTYRQDLEYLLDNYGHHPALYRRSGLPVVYFFAPYLVPLEGWARLLAPQGDLSIRGTPYDIVALAQATNTSFIDPLVGGYFDGMYMYDASGLTNLRLMLHWPYLDAFARAHGKIFIPTVGPGYDDRRIRSGDRGPWVVPRQGFTRYDAMWRMALGLEFVPPYITVTSFNEWGEGTQIEPAAPHLGYEDYGTLASTAYLDHTARWVDAYLELLKGHPWAQDGILLVAAGGMAVMLPLAVRNRWGRPGASITPGGHTATGSVHAPIDPSRR